MMRGIFGKLRESRHGAATPTMPAKAPTSQEVRTIDRAEVEGQALALALSPRAVAPRNPRLIVSLTSYPARIDDAFYAIVSLLQQTLTADAVILWLTASQFPAREADVPARILSMCDLGLEIRWWDEPIRSYTKLVPAMRTYPDDIIVTADDDIYYPERWLEMLHDAYRREPGAIHAHRVHRCRLDDQGLPAPYAAWDKSITAGDASALNFATGCGGVLYPPHSLHPDATRTELFSALCPTADDVWFWCMAVRQGTKTRAVEGGFASLIYVDAEREMGMKPGTTLYEVNRTENDRQIRHAFSLFDDDIRRALVSCI